MAGSGPATASWPTRIRLARTLVFSTEGQTVVTDASTRRDARGAGNETGDQEGGDPQRRSTTSVLDLPETTPRKRDGEGLVN